MIINTKFGSFDLTENPEKQKKYLEKLLSEKMITAEEFDKHNQDAKVVKSAILFPHDDLGNPVE